MAAAAAFNMECMDSSAIDDRDGVGHRQSLVQAVSVQRHLKIRVSCATERGVDGSQGGTGVLMNFQAADMGQDRFRQGGINR